MASDNEILDAAIHWRIRLEYNTADAATRQAFALWLQERPAHAQVWERLQALGARLQTPGGEFSSQSAAQVLRQTAKAQRSRRKALMSLAGLGAGGMLAWQLHDALPLREILADASSPRGERRELHLPDGGTLLLNTGTAVNIRYDAAQRCIELLAGEIYLVSGKDPAGRPLFVQTRDGRAQALGTRYRVRQFEQHSEVAVDEGEVALWPRDRDQQALTLHAGERARLTVADAQRMTADDGLDAGSWVEGALSVRDMPLADFLTELARYHGAIVCDPAAARLKVSGVFQLQDTQRILTLLRQALPITVQSQRRWWGARVTHVSRSPGVSDTSKS